MHKLHITSYWVLLSRLLLAPHLGGPAVVWTRHVHLHHLLHVIPAHRWVDTLITSTQNSSPNPTILNFPQSPSLLEKDYASNCNMAAGISPWSLLFDMSKDFMPYLSSGTKAKNWLFSSWSSERKQRLVKEQRMGPENLLVEIHIFFRKANWEKKLEGIWPKN